MIDRLETILNEITRGLNLEGAHGYLAIAFSCDEWRFIHKCLANYQAQLVKEINNENNKSD